MLHGKYGRSCRTIYMRRVVITGATGVVGMALINKCIESGIEAVALVNPESRRIGRIPSDPLVKVIKCGLEDFAGVDADSLGFKADAMFHLAWGGTFGDARNDQALQDLNHDYAMDAVRLANTLGCSVFVGAGSQAEYGRVSGKLKADTPCDPENEYGRSKLLTSADTRALCREFGIRHVWPRILSIYGPYDGEKTMVMSVIAALLNGSRPSLTDGEQQWDFLYASDAADALMLLAKIGKDGGVYPIGSGVARPLFPQQINALHLGLCRQVLQRSFYLLITLPKNEAIDVIYHLLFAILQRLSDHF